MNRKYPLPLVKMGIVSSMQYEPQLGCSSIILDGHNNPGFSGGPVVFIPDGHSPGNASQFSVAGVVASYPTYNEPVFDNNQKETNLFIQNNPGLVIVYDIQHAVKLIEANPIGFELSVD